MFSKSDILITPYGKIIGKLRHSSRAAFFSSYRWNIILNLKFDRVEKIIIGGYNSDGLEDPLKITLVYKTGIRSELDGRNFKPQRRNAAGVQIGEELCFHASNEGE